MESTNRLDNKKSIDLNKSTQVEYPTLSISFAVLGQRRKSGPNNSSIAPQSSSADPQKSVVQNVNSPSRQRQSLVASIASTSSSPSPSVNNRDVGIELDHSMESDQKNFKNAKEAIATWNLGKSLGMVGKESDVEVTGKIEDLIVQDTRNQKLSRGKGKKEKMRSSSKSK